MSIDHALQFFAPKDKKFQSLFIKAADNIVIISQKLRETIKEIDIDKRANMVGEIEMLEHEGDKITHDIIHALNTVFITPFDREDIYSLATTIDDINDHIKDAALRIRLYKPVKLPSASFKMAELLCEGTVKVRDVIEGLKNMNNREKLRRLCIDINSIEKQSDAIFEIALADLFANEKDPIELIKIKDILAKMESAADRCEDIANVIDGILVKTT